MLLKSGTTEKYQCFYVSTKPTLSRGRGMWQKLSIPVHFQHFSLIVPSLWQYLALKICWCVHFFNGEGVCKSVCLYTYENVDIL